MRKLIFAMLLALRTVTAAGAPPTLDLQLVANNLTNVTCIANAGDGSARLFVTERAGVIKVIAGTQVLAPPFLDMRPLVLSDAPERGLLGVAFHPGYATNGTFYVYFTALDSSNVVARFTNATPGASMVNTNTMITVIRLPHPGQNNHNGGDLQFGPDGYLYIGPGDGGSGCDPPNNAQNLGSPLGKLLRLDVNNFSTNYSIPPSNPFIATNGALPEIWVYGLRNPWRFSFDRATGDLFIGDVGQSQREEVDFQAAGSAGGQNYGWRVYEGSIFSTQSCPTVTVSNMPAVFPIFEYDHTGGRIAIIGGYRYRGAAIPPLVGTYLYADEKGSGPIYAATQSVAAVWSSLLLTNTPFTITTFGEDQSGELYFSNYASGTAGAVYRLVWKDSDGDGMPDDSETLAGTDPTNSASSFRITSVVRTGNDVSVSWMTGVGKTNALQAAAGDGSGGYSTNGFADIFTVTNTVGSVTNYLDSGGATNTPARYYRVRLVP
jgi:glucose/arabinose dehydrogenase